MQVSVESTGNLERRINFSLPAEQLESSVSGRLREIARTARIKGFRPGKVPARVIEQRFCEQVKAEVLGGLVRQTLDSAIREHDLRLDPKRLNETLRLIASTYEEPEQVVEMYRNDPQLMQGLQNRVMEEQVIDWIAERAQHTEVPLSFQDAIRG